MGCCNVVFFSYSPPLSVYQIFVCLFGVDDLVCLAGSLAVFVDDVVGVAILLVLATVIVQPVAEVVIFANDDVIGLRCNCCWACLSSDWMKLNVIFVFFMILSSSVCFLFPFIDYIIPLLCGNVKFFQFLSKKSIKKEPEISDSFKPFRVGKNTLYGASRLLSLNFKFPKGKG